MAEQPYDPQKRRERYLATRELKGRPKAVAIAGPVRTPSANTKKPKDAVKAAQERVGRLKTKVSKLEGALTAAMNALAEKRRNEAQEKKESSDGKTTAKERQASKEYREKNQAKIESKEKSESKETKSTSGGSSTTSVSEMSSDQLSSRISSIRSALSNAKQQLSEASKALSSLAHSNITAAGITLVAPISRKESVTMTADFGGYATRHDTPCADGRTILPGAFQENDGQIVPLVWQHGHTDIDNVLGHCRLEYRPEGVYAHAYFNETARGKNAKMQVQHGDLKYLSIFANKLHEKAVAGVAHAKNVVKGNIREVSLVIAGANPGAYIDNVNIQHSDGSFTYDDTEALITTGLEIELNLAHADDDELTVQDILDTLNEEQETAVQWLLSQALLVDSGVKHDDLEADQDDETDEEGDDEGTDAAVDENTDTDAGDETNTDDTNGGTDTDAGADVQHDNQEDNSMTHNVFDQANQSKDVRPQITLKHDDIQGIVTSAKKNGSLKEAVEEYALAHGIENIEYLFPDAQLLENSPAFISRRMEWVDKVLSSVRKSPFSRIRTITADITPDEARARGYIKGNMKNEEFFALSKRETTPQTVYKKQKLDRDDVIDIVNLDVVAWLKAEMKVMLDEEIAGAILVGDGRSIGDDDKIKETNIRPIATDAELYVTTVNVNLDDASSSIEELVDAVIENRRYYKGSGQPTFYTTESVISRFLTVKDNFGRRIYDSLAAVASVLRVSDIVPVEIMERDASLVGIMVNLSDYTLGADRGGQATMFDDFDIDYNKLRYLIETRLSGALTQPKSGIVFRKTAGSSVLRVPAEPTFENDVVTVPTVTGVTYKNKDTDATLTTGAPVTLTEGQTLNVIAVPAAGSHFANNAEDEWSYTNDVDA